MRDDRLVAGLSAAGLTNDQHRGHVGFDADLKPGETSSAFKSFSRLKSSHVRIWRAVKM
jgi:hypothetical protein